LPVVQLRRPAEGIGIELAMGNGMVGFWLHQDLADGQLPRQSPGISFSPDMDAMETPRARKHGGWAKALRIGCRVCRAASTRATPTITAPRPRSWSICRAMVRAALAAEAAMPEAIEEPKVVTASCW